MKTLLSVLNDFGRFFSFKTRKGQVRLIVLVVIFITGLVLLKQSAKTDDTPLPQYRTVSVAAVQSFSDSISTQLIGTVSSVDQAVIQSESSGRVTSVEVSLGQSVSQGQIIARLENASEYASLLQAEGMYEGALASAKISDISASAAKNNLVSAHNSAYSAYTSAYSVLQDIYQSDLDLIVADPENTFRTPGFSLIRNYERINDVDDKFEELGRLFSNSLIDESTVDSVSLLLDDAQSTSNLMMTVINELQLLINDDDDVKTAYETTALAYLSTLSSAQSQIDTVLLSLKNADTTLTNAKTTLEKTQLGGTAGQISVANAQVKQVLGSLKAAQANYNKTILRSPITGVVNSIEIKTGDFVTSFQTIAEIANNDALEVTTYVGQSDRDVIAVQQEILIEGVIPGVVSTIAPAVNPSTGKIEVKIQSASPDLINGETVTVTLGNYQADSNHTALLQVPLTAVKFTSDAGSVFTIEEDKLVAHPVEIGSVRDTYIEVVSGLTSEMEIVVDARGLSEGEIVNVSSN